MHDKHFFLLIILLVFGGSMYSEGICWVLKKLLLNTALWVCLFFFWSFLFPWFFFIYAFTRTQKYFFQLHFNLWEQHYIHGLLLIKCLCVVHDFVYIHICVCKSPTYKESFSNVLTLRWCKSNIYFSENILCIFIFTWARNIQYNNFFLLLGSESEPYFLDRHMRWYKMITLYIRLL
jgi:hypothetical protein